MNSKQRIFITSLGVSAVVVVAWILSLTCGISFSEALVCLGITGIISGIIAGCVIGADEIYDALEEQEAKE